LSVLRHPRQRKTNGRSTFLITIPRRRRALHGDNRRFIFRLDQEVDAMDVAITQTDPALADLVRGAEAGEGAAQAKLILEFETKLAQPRLTLVQRRDPNATYNALGLKGTMELMPSFDWKAAFRSLGIPESTQVIVGEPAYLRAVEKEFTATPLSTWKTWMRWKTIASAAPYLSKAFVDESFRFQSTVLTGVKEQEPRWKTCTGLVDSTLGDALGEAFVKKHFPQVAKTRMMELVENLRVTLRMQLEGSGWMEAETKKAA
jgi:predicted metalloendopeptidase